MTDIAKEWRVRLVAADPLILESRAGTVYALNPRTAGRVRIGAGLVQWLVGMEDPSDAPVDIQQRLLSAGLLVSAENPPGRGQGEDDWPIPWRYWGALGWAFHSSTQDAKFIKRGSSSLEQWQEELQADSPPSLTSLLETKHGSSALLLPRVLRRPAMPLSEVLENRRTHRHFEQRSVDLDGFSAILRYTFGPMRFADARELGSLQLRSYISSGARHETTAVVAVFNVHGIPPGLYVYDEIRHGLVDLGVAVAREEMNECTGDQGFYDTCAFGIVTVADTAAMAWKYRHPRTYRVMMNNVGAFAQVFSMLCRSMDLGAAVTGALSDTRLAELLSLDSPREIVTFSLACGYPLSGRTDEPADFLPASSPYEVVKGYRGSHPSASGA